ncbi:two-component sensor histidine kinase [Paenibacillus agaridevorans]|uniref:Two-component sensor histidine kinase n=1 Tax=Paenibacillus agaridevorans TaxID=171404 RepID=A0A2R5ENE1_9BACL|nr:sensor histidine kinase [Paenibacillus agaridevorans]GBG08077.1 two-component sensor histidine kinase [Paenibacillus agaridevorans]
MLTKGVTSLDYLGRQSLRNKLQIAFLAIIVISVLMTGGLSYYISAATMEKNALKLTQDTVARSAQIVDEKLNKLMLIMMTFMISQPFDEMLRDVVFGDDSRYYKHLSDLDNVFSQARVAEPLIHSIYVSTPIGEFYPSSMNRNRKSAFEDTFLYERIGHEKRNLWVEGHEDMLFSGKDRVISLILEPIFDTPVSGVYIVVNIREDGFRKLVQGDTGGGASSFLLDDEGETVYPPNERLVREAVDAGNLRSMMDRSEGSQSFELNGETYLLNYAGIGIADWTMTTIQSRAGVLKDLVYVKWLIAAVALAAFIVTTLISGAFSRYLLMPLQGLMKVMKRVENNDLTARFESGSGDELGQVGHRFNRMLEQIVVLIDEVTEAQTLKRSAEIKALSAQMDPHFLYNTLNTIYWKLKLKQIEPSQQMVMSLSRLFQLGLNNGQEITTLSKELEHVRQYLELQLSCYEGLFTYEIHVREPELIALSIPRILLQPLTENSILHGFRDLKNGGRIEIEIDEEGELWTIVVRDNGKGMEEDVVRALFGLESKKGYAVSNLIRRLQLYYGDKATLEVNSKPEHGTEIRISLPKRGEQFE